MDSDEQPVPDDGAAPAASSEPPGDTPGELSDAAPLDDEATGAAPTTDQPAADGYGNPTDNVGDFTDPDVDLSGLTPTSDGDPDDEQDPAVEDVSAGEPGEQADEGPDYHGDGRRGSWGTSQ